VIRAKRATTLPCSSVTVTSVSSIGDNHPSDAPPIATAPLRPAAAARAMRWRNDVLATIAGANHTSAASIARKASNRHGRRRRARGFGEVLAGSGNPAADAIGEGSSDILHPAGSTVRVWPRENANSGGALQREPTAGSNGKCGDVFVS
jgi:hypothetical protein